MVKYQFMSTSGVPLHPLAHKYATQIYATEQVKLTAAPWITSYEWSESKAALQSTRPTGCMTTPDQAMVLTEALNKIISDQQITNNLT